MTGASPVERVSRDEIVSLASRLISIPSTSGEERAVMEEVIRWCTEAGLPFQVIASDHDRPTGHREHHDNLRISHTCDPSHSCACRDPDPGQIRRWRSP